jgi:hypothetical protein
VVAYGCSWPEPCSSSRLVFYRDGWRGFPWAKGIATPATPVSPWALVRVLAFLGSFVTLAAFAFFNWGLSRLPAARASLFLNLIPVIAVLLGWVLLGESLSIVQCFCAAAVIGGVLLGQGLPAPVDPVVTPYRLPFSARKIILLQRWFRRCRSRKKRESMDLQALRAVATRCAPVDGREKKRNGHRACPWPGGTGRPAVRSCEARPGRP